MERDFTFDTYRDLLIGLLRSDFEILTIRAFLSRHDACGPLALLRHDVDRRPENALQMAKLEASIDIRSTYYFRVCEKVFDEELIKAVSALGHEIGYHYEVLDRARGDVRQALLIFEQELARLRRLALVDTACMHGNPLTPWNNLDFWQHYSLAQFALQGEAYLSIRDPKLYYTTDTGRGWNRGRYNLKDFFGLTPVKSLPAAASTRQLMELVGTREYPKIYLQIHPNRWSWLKSQWYRQWGEDLCLNGIKLLLAFYYKHFRASV